jgi:glycosyltransferase involved in cell wall biosynthesis
MRDTLDHCPLRICLLSYRGNPHCGGQGVYIRHLSEALRDLGHRVDVVSGPPYPALEEDIKLFKLASLDLYNPENLFRMPSRHELLNPINLIEWLDVSTMGFPEPLTFGIRVNRFLRRRYRRYDIVHDNQSLSYGIRSIAKRIPTVATIHHPITIDRDLSVRSTHSFWKKLQQLRWYSFIGMQKRVSRMLSHIITVSKRARDDIGRAFGIPNDQFRIVPNGIDTSRFKPIPGMKRQTHRIIATNSADTPLKGLKYLLEAVASVSRTTRIHLTVIGSPQKNGHVLKTVRQLDIGDCIHFTGRISSAELSRQYARAAIAVIPSIYEGFGFPAGEAMACATPVISTTAGALPELVGDAGIVVPPADSEALAGAIRDLLNNPAKALEMGQAGYQRIHNGFTWEKAAQKTVETYKEVIRDYHRLQQTVDPTGRSNP